MRPSLLFASSLVGLMVTAVSVNAAVVWESPQWITGDSDVVTTGELLEAYSLVDGGDYSGGNVIAQVSGVNFYAFAPNQSFRYLATQNFQGGYYGFGSANPPYSNLSSNYQTLLRFGQYSDTNISNPVTMTLQGLAENSTYLVQIWVNDSRGGGVRSEAFTSPGGDQSGALTFRGTDSGALGQYIVGTFTTGVGQSTQEITLDPAYANSVQVNALQLRVIPEPSTVALGALGVFGLLIHQMRRRWIA